MKSVEESLAFVEFQTNICGLEVQVIKIQNCLWVLRKCHLTYDEVDELRRGELQQGVAQLHGGRAEPHGAEGADQGGQDGDRLPVPEGDPPVAIVLLVPVTLPDWHDSGTPESREPT